MVSWQHFLKLTLSKSRMFFAVNGNESQSRGNKAKTRDLSTSLRFGRDDKVGAVLRQKMTGEALCCDRDDKVGCALVEMTIHGKVKH